MVHAYMVLLGCSILPAVMSVDDSLRTLAESGPPEPTEISAEAMVNRGDNSPHKPCNELNFLGGEKQATSAAEGGPEFLQKLKKCTDHMKNMAFTVQKRSQEDQKANQDYMEALEKSWALVNDFMGLNISGQFDKDQEQAAAAVGEQARALDDIMDDLNTPPFDPPYTQRLRPASTGTGNAAPEPEAPTEVAADDAAPVGDAVPGAPNGDAVQEGSTGDAALTSDAVPAAPNGGTAPGAEGNNAVPEGD
mmetsp:Transcript_119661/g.211470  ORF Transcript_119661/g.211470 Transcript_119661/m.211470 type:complete len:249 (+) Transcript_119661:81-827(+)